MGALSEGKEERGNEEIKGWGSKKVSGCLEKNRVGDIKKRWCDIKEIGANDKIKRPNDFKGASRLQLLL